MSKVNLDLAVINSDDDVWGKKTNDALSALGLESDAQDARLGLLETNVGSAVFRVTTLETNLRDNVIAKPAGGISGQVLTLSDSGLPVWRTIVASGGDGIGDNGEDYASIFQSALLGIEYTSPVEVTDVGDGTFSLSVATSDNGDGTFVTDATAVDNLDGTFSFTQ